MYDACIFFSFSIFLLVTRISSCFDPECFFKSFFDTNIIIITHKIIFEKDNHNYETEQTQT